MFNCTSRYNAIFCSSQLTAQSYDHKNTNIDMLTVTSSSSQTNVILAQNGDSSICNLNLTKSKATGIILAVEFTGIDHGEISYFTFDHNRGDTRDNSIVYVLDGESCIVHHGNFIDNKCMNSGYLFNFISPGTIENCIFKDNERAVLMAIRYYVTFVECVFDGADTKTEFMTVKSCHFLTETATWKFTMIDCNVPSFVFDRKSTFSGKIAVTTCGGCVAVVIGAVWTVLLVFRNEDDEKMLSLNL